LGRPAAGTKIGALRVHHVRTRGGNRKFRGLRMDTGNFSWGSEAITRKTRILDVKYNASNNELLRTKTLVKNAIIEVDSAPFRLQYEQHYGVKLPRKKGTKKDEGEGEAKTLSKKTQKKYEERQKTKEIEQALVEQFTAGECYVGIDCCLFLKVLRSENILTIVKFYSFKS